MADQNDTTQKQNENDERAKALIEALGPKVAEAVLPTIQEAVEKQIGGVLQKNEELLGKLHESKQSADLDKLLAAAAEQQRSRLDKDGTYVPKSGGPDAVRLKKSHARDVASYREAKAEAARLGVPLQIIAD